MTTATLQGIEIASARKFCDFSAREGSPAAIFHEIFEFSNFAPGLEWQKSGVQEFFRDTAAQPQPPAHISQQTDGRILKTIARIQSRKPKRAENAPKFCSPNFCFEAPAVQDYLDGGYLNRLYKSCANRNDHSGAARH